MRVLTDDCRRVGRSVTSFEVLKLGTYARVGPTLSFTPDGEAAPAFTGQLEGDYVRLTLPAEFEALAPNDLELRVGPDCPFDTSNRRSSCLTSACSGRAQPLRQSGGR